MKFSQEFIERVSSANNLVDIISQYTTLKPAGGGLMGRCPFPDHPEKTPSFSVSEVKQVYNCFGCHKKGNIFTFLETYNGMSFPEAVEYLANRASISMPTVDREQSEKLDKLAIKKRQILNVNKLAMQFFMEQFKLLPKDHRAKVYANKRGLTPDLIEIFKIGYAPAEWDSLLQYLTGKGIPLDLMEEAKLIKARSTGSGYFDLFRERLMFTILDTKNEVVAFGGRILDQGDVKYMNSPETLVFSKSRTLYGLSETSKYIRSEDQAIVVEGYMDLIALYRAGFKNVVAPMGTALTGEQSRMLARQTQNVFILFDGDEAGKNAAEKSLPILLEANLHPKGLTLPDDLDPDDFLNRDGKEALQEALKAAPDLFVLILNRWLKDYRGESSQKVQLADRLKPLFAAIVDPRLRELYLTETALKLDVDARWLKSAIESDSSQQKVLKSPTQKSVHTSETIISEPSQQDKIVLKGATQAEITLMAVALKNRANFSEFLSLEVFEKILHPGVKKVLETAAGVYGQDLEKFDRLSSLLSNFVDEPEKLFLSPVMGKINESASEGSVEISNEKLAEEIKLLQDCVIKIRERFIKFQSHQIAQEIKSQPTTPEQLDPAKLEQFMNLQKRSPVTSKYK